MAIKSEAVEDRFNRLHRRGDGTRNVRKARRWLLLQGNFRHPGVYAHERTLEETRRELKSALEDWIVFGLVNGFPIPAIDGIQIETTKVASCRDLVQSAGVISSRSFASSASTVPSRVAATN